MHSSFGESPAPITTAPITSPIAGKKSSSQVDDESMTNGDIQCNASWLRQLICKGLSPTDGLRMLNTPCILTYGSFLNAHYVM